MIGELKSVTRESGGLLGRSQQAPIDLHGQLDGIERTATAPSLMGWILQA